MNLGSDGRGVFRFRVEHIFHTINSHSRRKYVGGFRLFHCSANKPSGWTKEARRGVEHVRGAFRRASTPALDARLESSHLERLDPVEGCRPSSALTAPARARALPNTLHYYAMQPQRNKMLQMMQSHRTNTYK